MKMTRKLLSTREGTLAFAALAGLIAVGLLLVFMTAYRNSVDEGAQPVTVLVARESLPKGVSGDVIAEKAGLRLIVQCKRYGRPVGNAAVQEVAAATLHWSGDMAAVVSNAGFTPAARKLAGTTGVYTFTPEDHLGLDLSAFRMLEIKGGEWTLVE